MSILDRTMDDPLWPATDHIVSRALVRQVADGAVRADVEGRIDDETFRGIRESNYLRAPIPEEFKGLGASLLECCAAQRVLGAADPALAIALNMHMFSVGILATQNRYHRDHSWLMMEAIATQKRVVASAFGEPGLGGSIFRSFCRAREVEGGYVVSGKKTPCSLASRCDLICLQMEGEASESPALLFAAVPRTADGIRVSTSWTAFGMRASESDTIELQDCFIPEQLVFHRGQPGRADDPILRAGLTWFCLTTTSTYLGTIAEFLRVVGEGLTRSPLGYLDTHRSDLPTYQGSLGDAVATVKSLECATAGLANLIDEERVSADAAFPAALALKHQAVRDILGVASEMFSLLGAGAYSKNGPLFRLWRDLQAIRFHPPTPMATKQILGRYALGKPFTLETFEHPVR